MAGTLAENKPPELRLVSPAMIEVWTGYAILAALAVAAVIEGLLAVRLWAELTSQDVASGVIGSVYSLTNGLVAPFLPADSDTAIRSTGIFEVATLTAIEVYLIGGLVTIGALFILRIVFHVSARRQARREGLAAFGDESALAARAGAAR
jgi:hypothetical protein